MHLGGRHPSRQTPPWADTPQADPLGQTPSLPTATAADGTHHTGMLSCYRDNVAGHLFQKFKLSTLLIQLDWN